MSVFGFYSSSLTAEAFPFSVSSLVFGAFFFFSFLFFFPSLSLQFSRPRGQIPVTSKNWDLTTPIFFKTHIYFPWDNLSAQVTKRGQTFKPQPGPQIVWPDLTLPGLPFS